MSAEEVMIAQTPVCLAQKDMFANCNGLPCNICTRVKILLCNVSIEFTINYLLNIENLISVDT